VCLSALSVHSAVTKTQKHPGLGHRSGRSALQDWRSRCYRACSTLCTYHRRPKFTLDTLGDTDGRRHTAAAPCSTPRCHIATSFTTPCTEESIIPLRRLGAKASLESLEPPSVRLHHVHQAAEAAVSRISIDSSADHDSGTYSQDSGYMDSGHLTCRNTM